LDDITESGCLLLLLTGGESLLRTDFPDIYSRAKWNGMLVTVFTNGTLITEPIVELFQDLPPDSVEISLYGASPETHDRIAGVEGAYEKCREGIERLLRKDIRVSLKTLLMTGNLSEYEGMKAMAEAYGVPFRFDAALFPCLDGDKTPLGFRVSPEEAVEKEFSDEGVAAQWRKYMNTFQAIPRSDDLFQCGAGLTTFHISPYGFLQPCLMVTDISYDLLSGNFVTGWEGLLPPILGKKAAPGFPCKECDKMVVCGFCPAFFKLETGAESVPSEFLCAIGEKRFQAIELDEQKRAK